jgi:hypothetical protein
MSKDEYVQASTMLQHHIAEAIRLNEKPEGEHRTEASKLEKRIKSMIADGEVPPPFSQANNAGASFPILILLIGGGGSVLLALVLILLEVLSPGLQADKYHLNAPPRSLGSDRSGNYLANQSISGPAESVYEKCNHRLDIYKKQFTASNRSFANYLELNRIGACEEAFFHVGKGMSTPQAIRLAINSLVARWDSKVDAERNALNREQAALLIPALIEGVKGYSMLQRERLKQEGESMREKLKQEGELLKEVGRAF